MKEVQIHELSTHPDRKQFLESCIQNDTFDVCFIFGSSFVNAKLLRDTVDMVCAIMWLDSKWKTRMVLIVDELNNNAIEYGSKETDMNKLHIYIKKEPWNSFDIKISVQDSGNGEHAKSAQEMEELRDTRTQKWFKNHNSIRWRWLFMIISNLVDILYFKDAENKGLIVWIEKKL